MPTVDATLLRVTQDAGLTVDPVSAKHELKGCRREAKLLIVRPQATLPKIVIGHEPPPLLS